MDQKKSDTSSSISRSPDESKIASQTPQKTNEPLLTEPKISERYKIIAEFFDRMTCSLRLLNLCKKSPTFRNVSAQVDVLTQRKFLYRHLAQIKYILPEAVQVDSTPVHDKTTLCMRPEVKITLLLDGIDEQPEQSRVMALRELFASRLEDFVSSHPEACDVPEAVLPEIFDQSLRTNNSLEEVPPSSVMQSQPASEVGNLLEVPSVLQHLRKHFSEKVIIPESEKTSLLVSSHPLPSMHDQESGHENCLDSLCAQPDILNGHANNGPDEATPAGFPGFTASINSSQLTEIGPSAGSIACESPGVKVSSSADRLLIETPGQLTPNRAILTGDNYRKSMCTEKCPSCNNKPTKRSLNFSVESDGSGSSFTVGESESCEHVLSNSICATVPIAEQSISTSGAKLQAQKSFCETSSGICRQMSSCLPGTVAVIDDIFRDLGCSSITKEQLVHKIIFNNYDIVERREVEEQVELLEKLVPDWIYRESTPSGDIVYSVKRASNIESILSRLTSA